MKKLLGALPLLAAAMAAFALAPRANAQLVTFETLSAYNGGAITGFTGGNTALTQTFTNVLELQSVTYRFTTTGTDNSAQSFSAYLVQWNAAGPNKVATTFSAPIAANSTTDSTISEPTVAVQNFTIPAAGTGAWQTDTFAQGGTYAGYDVQLTLNQYTDPNLTYAIILVDNSNTSGLGLLDVNGSVANPTNGDAFPYGTDYSRVGVNNTTVVSDLETSPSASVGGQNFTGDYGFSQIVVVPQGNVVPVPEPRTAAAILCALFVAALVGRQMLLRRQEDAAVSAALVA